MKQEIKQQWVDALRSGDYNQTAGWLHNDKGFCCLGVLCDLAAKAGVVTADRDEETGRVTYVSVNDSDDINSTVLPRAVVEWADVLDEKVDDSLALASKNDSGDYSFNDIADIIERKV